ncbi:MAG: hypothetical protein R3F20_18240 [Planctomycetota bacterium]
MRSALRLILAVVGLAILAVPVAAQGEKPTPETPDPAKKPGEKVEKKPPLPGRILGRVVWKGPVFAPREVLWPAGLPDADEKIAALAAAKPVLDRRLLVDAETGGVAACVVSLPALRLPAEPPRRLELVISGLAFSTRAAVLPEGWTLQLRNEDPITHRFVLRRGRERVRDVEVGPGATALVDGIVGGEHRLESERLPFLAARIVPRARTPRVTTDRAGSFDIRGAPAGPLEIEIDHETLGRVRRQVEVPDGGTLELEVLASDFARADEEGLPFGPAGAIALEIEGIAVPRAYLERLADFMARRHPAVAMPRRICEEEALRRGALPLAAMWSRTAERRAELAPRLAEIRALLDSVRTSASWRSATPTSRSSAAVARCPGAPGISSRTSARPCSPLRSGASSGRSRRRAGCPSSSSTAARARRTTRRGTSGTSSWPSTRRTTRPGARGGRRKPPPGRGLRSSMRPGRTSFPRTTSDERRPRDRL